MMRWYWAVLVLLASGCKALDQGSGAIADSLAPPDPVTGARTLNVESEQTEISDATKATNSILAEARTRHLPMDEDAELVGKLHTMLGRLAPVSHRPQLPWEVHVIGSPTVNAFAIGGGKMFFFSGIRELARTDDELAAVLAHEMAHNTCRHITEAKSAQISGLVSKRFERDAGSSYYAASFTNQQEDEADRVSLLYLALAGYDPGVVPGIWQRAHARVGSDPGDYTFNHSLNAGRAAKTASVVPTARQAFKGDGVTNPDYRRLLVESPVIDRHESTSGFLALLETAANALQSHATTLADARQREAAARRAGQLAPDADGATRGAAAAPDAELAAAFRLQQAGRLDDAKVVYERVIAREPRNAAALYNLACICATQGEPKRALNLLDRSVDAGFRDAAHMKVDPDLASLRATRRYREILKRAGTK